MADRSQAIESAILDAARRVFAQKGYDEATVADLLEGASISRRTFYRYFDNREAVLLRLYENWIKELQAALFVSSAGAATAWERMMKTLPEYLRFHSTDTTLLRTVIAQSQRTSSALYERRRSFRTLLVQLVESAVTERRGGPIDPLTAVGLVAVLDRLSSHLLETGAQEDDVRRVERVIVGFLEAASDPNGPIPSTH